MRSSIRRTLVLVGSGTVVLAAACSSAPVDTGEDVGKNEQAVFAVDAQGNAVTSNDADPGYTVVRFPHLKDSSIASDPIDDDAGCTGILITSRLVLTSKFCVSTAKIGGMRVVELRKRDGSTVRRIWDSVDTGAPADIAIVRLAPPANKNDVYDWAVRRPVFADPPFAPQDMSNIEGGQLFPEAQIVGWSPYGVLRSPADGDNLPNCATKRMFTDRQRVTVPNAHLTRLGTENDPTFFSHGVSTPNGSCSNLTWALHDGDVGSPLFLKAAGSSTLTLAGIATS